MRGELRRVRGEAEGMNDKLAALESDMVDFHHRELDQDREELDY